MSATATLLAVCALLAVAAADQTATLKTADQSLTVSVSSSGELMERYRKAGGTTAVTYTGPTIMTSSSSTSSPAPCSFTSVVAADDGSSVTVSGVCAGVASSRVISVSEVVTSPLPGFRVQHTLTNTNATAAMSFVSVDDWYTTAIPGNDTAEFALSPSLKLTADDVSPHWQFKTPAVLLQHGTTVAAVVANVSAATNASLAAAPVLLDVFNDGMGTPPRLSYGVAATVLSDVDHIYQRSGAPLSLAANASITLDATVLVQTAAASSVPAAAGPQGYTALASFLWAAYGAGQLLATPGQQANVNDTTLTTFQSYRDAAWLHRAQQLYASAPCPASAAVGADGYAVPSTSPAAASSTCATLRSSRLPWADGFGTTDDAWFTVLFQGLRTAVGMAAYATATSNTTLATQAAALLTTALSAPQSQEFVFRGGPFPSTAYIDANGEWQWVPSSGFIGLCRVQPGFEVPEDCTGWLPTPDNSWTGFWMLQQWRADPSGQAVLPFLNKYAMFLDKVQRTTPSDSGVIPSYFIYNTTREEFISSEILGPYNADMAIHALFLFEMYSVTSNPDIQNSARRALQFVTDNVLASRRWFTADLFFGASNIELNTTDTFTGQVPESNIAKLAAAAAYLRAYQLTKNATLLQLSESVAQYAMLTQSVVNHPALGVDTFGGFTTQNTDAQWSDSRSSYAADVLLLLYAETGNLQYLQRGVAALRASLTVSPYMSWAPDGSTDVPGADASFHAGMGSAVASVENWLSLFGSAVVVLPLKHAVCIDGCTFTAVTANATAIAVDITTPFTFNGGFTLVVATQLSAMDAQLAIAAGTSGTGLHAAGVAAGVVHGPAAQAGGGGGGDDDDDDGTSYALVVNGHNVGTYTSEQLLDGVTVPGSALSSSSL